MESQLGLVNVWAQGDWVTRSVVVLLLGMSLASWIVILVKAFDIVRFKRLARGSEAFWHSSDFAQGLGQLGAQEGNPFRSLAEDGREATNHHSNTRAQLHDSLDISDWVTRALRNSIDDTVARMQSGLAILASVGSTAPFVGLFGTVWGIMHAFTGLASLQQVTLATVAPGIAEALVATAIGLFAAIPAVVAYNNFARDIDRIAIRLETFIEEFSNILQRSSSVSAQPAPGR